MTLACLLIAILSPVCLLQEGPEPRTFLERALLDRSPLIVRARFVQDGILEPTSVQVTTFEVIQVLRGSAGKTVLVGAMGERGSAYADLEKLLFLRPLRSGLIHELVDVVDLTAAEAEVAPSTVAAYLELADEPHPLKRLRRLRDLSLQGLESRSVFATRVAVRELGRLVEEAPYLFTSADLIRLRNQGARVPMADRELHARLVERLGAALLASFGGCERSFEAGAPREAFLKALERFRGLPEEPARVEALDGMARVFGVRLSLFCQALLSWPEAQVRCRALWYLGEFGAEESLPGVLLRLGRAEGEELRRAVEAAGKIGSEQAVAVLRGLLDRPEVFDDVLLALARVGSSEALGLLERVESRLLGVPEEEERVTRLRHFRSPAFRREESQRQLEARRSYGA